MKDKFADAQTYSPITTSLHQDHVAYVVALTAFVAQTLHMLEHSVQLYQHMVLGLPPKLANGLLFFLDLEWNHFLFNSLYLVFLVIIFVRLRFWSTTSWGGHKVVSALFIAGFAIQSYHVIEHSVRMQQFLTTGCTPCTGIIGKLFNMIHLHFFLNIAAYLPLVLLLLRSGTLGQLLKTAFESKSDREAWLLYLESPAVMLVPILAYGVITGYSLDVYVFGVTLFTAVGLSFFFSIFEGRLVENLLDGVAVAILASMSLSMSYVSAVFLVLFSLLSSRIFKLEGGPRLNHIAISMTLLLIISSPSLAASRWGAYNLYTFFTIFLLLGFARAALSKSMDIVLLYIFSWMTLFIPEQLTHLELTPPEAILLFSSAAFKYLTNPLFGFLAFFIVPYPDTFPEKGMRRVYPLLCSGLAFLLARLVPIDLAAYAGVALSNILLFLILYTHRHR
ncbi:MAG: hypothetical protein RMJ28_03005 [Nitrososphaerota archaeon]|nr:hypothetical protein [Candidatus Calditenuaceae archaeon]MDW8073189.1 hypothetical protein [Nitrososphaerota archaeon]